MRIIGAVIMVVAVVFLASPPASAFDLTFWNQQTIQNSGDVVRVTIGTNTIEFQYVAGSNPPGTAKNMLDIFWDFSSPAETSNTDSYTIGSVTANATDGFNA